MKFLFALFTATLLLPQTSFAIGTHSDCYDKYPSLRNLISQKYDQAPAIPADQASEQAKQMVAAEESAAKTNGKQFDAQDFNVCVGKIRQAFQNTSQVQTVTAAVQDTLRPDLTPGTDASGPPPPPAEAAAPTAINED